MALNDGASGIDFTQFFVTSDLPAPQPVADASAKVTGGGSIAGAAHTGMVVQRKGADATVSGQWQFVNRETGDIVHSTSITSLLVIGNTATFSGTCRTAAAPLDPCTFRVTAHDNGDGQSGTPDTIRVDGVGFTGAAGDLEGNVDIH